MRKFRIYLSPVVAAMLLLAAFFCQNEKPIKKESTVELSQSDLMVIYKNGYLKGKLNVQLHSDDVKSEEVWQIDSFNLSKRFFK